ncbi:hypothetical protein PVAP13_1KG470910 [Panicum virgatum]|uniref:Uncharacterized protein n=1 Tax=Panicum virgatum TaxID=38727 RepID=A0A8T0XV14_PANVG|nr:hypothetical protein PVAP13_1KG470910 [Panicum virgatum]
MKSGGERSQFSFSRSPFSFTGGVESRTPPTSPPSPSPARTSQTLRRHHRLPAAAPLHARPPRPSPRSPTSRLPAPAAESPGPCCCGRCRTRPPSPECSRRGRGRGLSREPRPLPSRCVVAEGIPPFCSLS